MAAIDGEWYVCDGTGQGLNAQPGCLRYVMSTHNNGEMFIVAKVWAGDDGDYEATARLVAAAPSLLAALKVADDALDFSQAQVGDDRDADRIRDWRRQVQQALNKATGCNQ